MKTLEFNKPGRNITVINTEGELFNFSSYPEMLGQFSDLKNTEQWAKVHDSNDGESCVFICHTFDYVGKLVENHMSHEDAENYAAQLNEYYAICEELDVIEE